MVGAAVMAAIMIATPGAVTANAAVVGESPAAGATPAPGTVLSSTVAAPDRAHAGSLAGPEPETPATARVIRFVTRDSNGAPADVGAIVTVPDAPWEQPGPRPTVVVAPGTVGQADRCAPSASVGKPLGTDQSDHVAPLIKMGLRVVVADYIGLGAPGTHTYANRLDQGQAMLDAARAGLAIDGLPGDSPVAFWGYSQGGGAVASAAELAETYAPELSVAATFAGAPPADLSDVLTRIDGTMIMGAIGYAANGFAEREPQVRPIMDGITSPYGKMVLDRLSDDCIEDSALRVGLHRTNSWTIDGRSFADHFAEHPEIVDVVDRQRIGRLRPNAPVLVLNGRNDDVIPFGQARQLARDWCDLGADVTFLATESPEFLPGSAIGHSTPLMEGKDRALAFIAEHVGVPAGDGGGSAGAATPRPCEF